MVYKGSELRNRKQKDWIDEKAILVAGVGV
jgi:hypothetical protein